MLTGALHMVLMAGKPGLSINMRNIEKITSQNFLAGKRALYSFSLCPKRVLREVSR